MITVADMGLLQIVGIAFALFALSRAFLRYKDKSLRQNELFFWTIVWVGVICVAVFPSIFVTLSRVLGIGRGVDILLYGGMILLFYLLFRVYVKVEAQQKDMTTLVREIAIKNAAQIKELTKEQAKGAAKKSSKVEKEYEEQ